VKKSILLIGGVVIIFAGGNVLRNVLAHRNPQIMLPLEQIRQAVDVVTSEEQAEAEAEADARAAQVYESEMLSAHQAIKVGLQEWRGADKTLVCARANAIHRKLQEWSEKTSQPLEVVYQQELAAHISRVREWQMAFNTGVAGDAESIAQARAVAGDTEALLFLGDRMYSRQGIPICDTLLDAEITRLGLIYSEVAARADTRNENLVQLEQQHLEQANAFWDSQIGNTDSDIAPSQPDKPAEDTPERSRIQNFLYGEGVDD